MAGQVIIEGFLDIKFSVFLRRLITIIPALVVIALKLDRPQNFVTISGGAELRDSICSGPPGPADALASGNV